MMTRRILACVLVALLGSRCGTEAMKSCSCSQAVPEKDWSKEVVFEKEPPWPPEPPLVYRGPWEDDQGKPEALVTAEAEFEKKNYETALDGYRSFMGKNPKSHWVPHATFQMSRCHYQRSEYDDALEVVSAFIAAKPGTLWEARARIVLSSLYLALPTYGYEMGETITYDYEHREGEYRYLGEENQAKAIAALEDARLAYVSLVKKTPGETGASPEDDLGLEAVDAVFLLIRDIDSSSWDKYDPCPPNEPVVLPDPSGRYDPSWVTRQKLLYLFEDVKAMNAGREDTHPVAWAGFKKALFLMHYPECAPAGWLKESQKANEAFEKSKRAEWEKKTGKPSADLSLAHVLDDLDAEDMQAQRFDPGSALDPLAIVDALMKAHPGDPHIELYEATRGRIMEGRGEYLAAEKVYEKFLAKHPESPWAGDVEQSLHSMRKKSLGLDPGNDVTYPGQDARVTFVTRNLDEVQVDVYAVDLASMALSGKLLKDPYSSFTDVMSSISDFEGARKTLKKKVFDTTVKTGDAGDYKERHGSLILPADLPVGTYMIHAHAGGIEAIEPWIKSDIVIVGKPLADEMRFIVTDALTGALLPGIALTVKETYDQGWAYVPKVKVTKAQTDDEGRYFYPYTRGADISYNRVAVLARSAGGMAMTSATSSPYYHSSATGLTYRIFTATDRPVYRPGDTVRFRHVVRAYQDGKNVNEEGLKVIMDVRDPNGDSLLEKTKSTSAFGTVFGEVQIPEDAALGVYSAGALVKDHEWRSYQSSGSSFRVEEYKKPEFEVKVLPGKAIARPGDRVEARITATYYFGAPVGNAGVKYKIYRTPFVHSYVMPDRWDWLYGPGFGIVRQVSFAPGDDLVADGEGRTDDVGEMIVKLPDLPKDEERDYTFKVVAEITDPSRRVISGEGSLKVTRYPYYAYITPQHGFYTAGDDVEVEIRALTADDEPVMAKGTVTVARLVHVAGEEPTSKAVDERKLDLDAEGRAFYRFAAQSQGQYRVTYTSVAAEGGAEVEVERIVNVAGGAMVAKSFRFAGVDVTSEKRTYTRGDTITLFVQSPWEDATLWVTYEGGDEVFYDEILRPEGVGALLEVEATDRLHPSFFVRVTAVRDGKVHSVTREIFIPPGEEILDVSVKLDREEYEPRSKGVLDVTVKDHEGKPLVGEVSLSVFDRSVLYIQSETAGDIRSTYYGERRYHDVEEFHSAQIWLYGYSRDDTPWPYFDTYGLPTSYGSFSEPYANRGLYFTCPSCEQARTSPWKYEIPGTQAPVAQDGIHSGTGEGYGTIGLGNLGTIGHGGGGGSGAGYGRGGGGLKGRGAVPSPKMAKAPASVAMGRSKSEDILGALSAESAPLEDMAPGAPSPDAGLADVVRENFADTALWVPDLVTGADGRATTDVEWPDNLTTWAVRVIGVDRTSRVGIAQAEAVTTKKLVARIETPRFMIEGDVVTLTAVVNSDLAEARKVDLALGLTGGIEASGKKKDTITVERGNDASFDFEVLATEPGEISVTLEARAGDESDAVKKTLEVMEWGSDRMVARAGAMQAPGVMVLDLDLPAERRVDTTELVLTLDPTVATVVLKSMPYLIHYPYGCVEQTMSRFLPAAMVARTLKDMGIELSDIPRLARDATLADPVGSAHGAPQTWYDLPIYSDEKLASVIRVGLRRLVSFQHGDGGWGWWKDGKSDEYMTAYVLSGLAIVQDAGYGVDSYVIDRGMHYLRQKYDHRRNEVVKKKGFANIDPSERNLMAYLAYVLSLRKMIRFEEVEGLWEHRESMTHYGRALLALTMHDMGETEKAKLAVANLAEVAWKDEQNGTASFKFENKSHWRWYNNRIESVAWALRAFTAIEPEHELGPMFARWLVKNREGNRWFSTKDTALSILALSDYMRVHQELDPDYDVTVKIDGEERLSYHVGKNDIFKGKGTVILRGEELSRDEVHIEVTTSGKGAVYASAFLSYFTKEKTIAASGNEIAIERHYYRLHEVKKKVKTWYGEVTRIKYAREELETGAGILSGDLVEVKIVIVAKNDYEYLVFEDFKPAGCEPLALKSGGIYENGTWMNREMRDEKVVTFIPWLPQGEQIITYTMRAEIPGTFGVLPHNAYAMYAPRVKAISDSWKLVIGKGE